jgi:hypothetical protein
MPVGEGGLHRFVTQCTGGYCKNNAAYLGYDYPLPRHTTALHPAVTPPPPLPHSRARTHTHKHAQRRTCAHRATHTHARAHVDA